MMSQRTLVVVSDYDLFKAPEAERNAMTQILSDLRSTLSGLCL